MKFRTKLYLGFGSLLGLMLILQVLTLQEFRSLNREMNLVVGRQYEMVQQANIVRNEVNTIARHLRDIILDPEGSEVENYQSAIQEARTKAADTMQSLMLLTDNEEEKKQLTKVRLIQQAYTELEMSIISLAREGNRADATRLMYTDGRKARLQLLEEMNRLVELQENAMNAAVDRSAAVYQNTLTFIIISLGTALVFGLVMSYWLIRNVTSGINKVTSVMTGVADSPDGRLPRVEVNVNDEIGGIALAFNEMVVSLEEHSAAERQLRQDIETQNWLKTKVAEITAGCQGIQDITGFAKFLMSNLTPTVGASYGVFYVVDYDEAGTTIKKKASYASNGQDLGAEKFAPGESLVGQCVLEKKAIKLTEVPENYIKISSALGSAKPHSILVLPIVFENRVESVIELASFKALEPLHEMLIHEVSGSIGTAINRVVNHMRVEKLLHESQIMTEELQTQAEELQMQQEELKAINEKLEEQHKKTEQKTGELEKAKKVLEEKTKQLALNSKYKSEFLANMSHELRTPLNSLLILSQMLTENNTGNLTEKQVEYAKTIHSAGNDLLNLINDVLDLAKIESGKVACDPDYYIISELPEYIEKQFGPTAQLKCVDLKVTLSPGVPGSIYTDEQKLKQILKNLLSNAFKFTERGSVSITIRKMEAGSISGVPTDQPFVAFEVIDTGVGIPKEQQSAIFEAFTQADGTTSRKYGGTGLGLSISRELASLLGGFIRLDSKVDQGSTFTLYIPSQLDIPNQEPCSHIEAAATVQTDATVIFDTKESLAQPEQAEVIEAEVMKPQNRASLEGRKVLIVDDDMRNVFALTTALEAHKMNVLFAENGARGVDMLRENPDIDIVLMDIMMPEMDGYEAIRTIRQLPEFSHLPIIALTAKAMKNDREKCIEAGASDYLSKPVSVEQLTSLMRVWLYNY